MAALATRMPVTRAGRVFELCMDPQRFDTMAVGPRCAIASSSSSFAQRSSPWILCLIPLSLPRKTPRPSVNTPGPYVQFIIPVEHLICGTWNRKTFNAQRNI